MIGGLGIIWPLLGLGTRCEAYIVAAYPDRLSDEIDKIVSVGISRWGLRVTDAQRSIRRSLRRPRGRVSTNP